MVKTQFRILLPAMLLAALVAGCDTQDDQGAQGGETVTAETTDEALTGFVDRTFAGDEMPDVTVTDPQGATLALGEPTGKPVLLNLWATWCVPCVTEMPMLERIAGEMGERLTVLTVSEDLEGTTAVPAFFAEKGFEHLPQWLDQNNDLAFAFGGGGSLPLTVLYDAQGKEVWRVIGAYDWESEEARALLAEVTAVN
ncbi:TlpA family protein disulfide reductase [Alteraurantiacibacter buctensis]|uniref:Redoxin family protein n=1 Tax=Alteraurantiacibacter buctensis TaxID=1503981 RepID=A0A844YSD9_9SPHN|nr:TlpA disulfide reductase family protein [Alteraurantiacibacter buctensis]MXO71265.1 redoxin family protein [Alteraurantiacibacter buctensis]